MLPVKPVLVSVLQKSTFILILTSLVISAIAQQTLIAQSSEYSADDQSDKLWLQYHNTFEFKRGYFIDSDFGHVFNMDDLGRRLSVRSVFKYQLSENLKAGAGMGFFWNYGQPNLLQELRFVQEINYFKDYGSSLMFHDLRLEQRIKQGILTGDDYLSRLRYRVGVTIPTNGAMYFGVYDEIFKVLTKNAEYENPFVTRNRLAVMAGYNTFQLIRLEAHLMMEDKYILSPAPQTFRTLSINIVVKQVI